MEGVSSSDIKQIGPVGINWEMLHTLNGRL
jgi:hypothetical protein